MEKDIEKDIKELTDIEKDINGANFSDDLKKAFYDSMADVKDTSFTPSLTDPYHGTTAIFGDYNQPWNHNILSSATFNTYPAAPNTQLAYDLISKLVEEMNTDAIELILKDPSYINFLTLSPEVLAYVTNLATL